MLKKLASYCYARRWRILLAWIALLLSVGFLGGRFGAEPSNDFTLPDTESTRALAILQERFGTGGGDGLRVVFEAPAGMTDPAVRQRAEALLGEIDTVEGVVGVSSPYSAPGQISPDGRIAYAGIQFDDSSIDLEVDRIQDVKDIVDSGAGDGLRALLGGPAARFADQEPPFGSQELIALGAAVVILLITFGSVIAMGLPILTAIFGLGIGLSLVFLLGHLADVPEFAPQLASMIGLGVGIDYALFIVTRYRQALHAGADPEESVVVAIETSGRAVLFAGMTVVISLLGLFLIRLNFLAGVALGASMGVLVVMLASVTLLPAILGFVGRTIDRLHVPVLHRDESHHRASFWFRWSRFIQRRPLPAGVAGAVALLVLAIPLLGIELGSTDEGNEPVSSSARQAYDLLAEGFGPGFNGPLLLVAETEGPGDVQAFGAALQTIATAEGVVAVSPPIPNPQGTAVIATAIPATSPQDAQTRGVIERLRSGVIPAAEAAGAPKIEVGGTTAIFVDFTGYLADRLFVFIGAVLVLSFLLLLVVFRSVLIPLKAAIVNLLGIGAAYGVVVAVFQWGWLSGVFGVERTGPIEPFIPMMLFAIVFGLSMDYEVFLMSRIREEYVRTRRNDIAVADGLAATARVITAAAAIMVTLFLSFALADVREIKLFGLGLAAAIFLDATVIRMVVVPAFMEVLGDANWWLPRWLRWIPEVAVGEAEGVIVEPPEYARRARAPKPRATKVSPRKKSAAKPTGAKRKQPAKRSGAKKKPATRGAAAGKRGTPSRP